MTEDELERYVRMYYKAVCTAAFCCLKNAADADDVAQEVFLKLYTGGNSFVSDEHAKAWLLRCAINRSADVLKSHWYRYSLPLESAADKQCSDSYGGEDGEILALLGKLRPKIRIAMYMHYCEGYTVEELAKILGISGSSVRSRLMRGREQLRALLTDKEREENGYQGNI